MCRLKQNCNFQTETSFCASKSPKLPCILSCKAVFLSYKHNNDRNDEQALIRDLKQNCNFQTETSFCASKSPKLPCILSCKAVFLSYKHNNDRNDEQALIRKQNH